MGTTTDLCKQMFLERSSHDEYPNGGVFTQENIYKQQCSFYLGISSISIFVCSMYLFLYIFIVYIFIVYIFIVYIFIVYIFIVYIYYPTVVPWSSLGNQKPQLQAGEDSESCCLPACARYSCGKGYVPNPQVAPQGGLWGGLCGTKKFMMIASDTWMQTKWYFLGMSWNNQSANVWKHVLFGLAQRYVSAAFWPSHRFRMDDEHDLGTWLIECWGMIPSINGCVTFCNYGYEPLKWGTLQLYFWHSNCVFRLAAEFQHPVTMTISPPNGNTHIAQRMLHIKTDTKLRGVLQAAKKCSTGNLEWAPSFRPQPSPVDVDEAKALSKTGDEVHHGRWE